MLLFKIRHLLDQPQMELENYIIIYNRVHFLKLLTIINLSVNCFISYLLPLIHPNLNIVSYFTVCFIVIDAIGKLKE